MIEIPSHSNASAKLDAGLADLAGDARAPVLPPGPSYISPINTKSAYF
jgi:hypothetical protein